MLTPGQRKIVKHIPNTITGARFILTIAFLAMILYSPKVTLFTLWMDWAFVLFVLTGITDIIDGKLARLFQVTSKFGRIMDPLADKVLVCGSFICFALVGMPTLFPDSLGEVGNHILRWSAAAIIIARETLVTIVRQRAESKGIQFAANAWGKLKMFIQIFGIGTVVIQVAHVPVARWGMWVTLGVYAVMIFATVMSGVQYFTRKEAVDAGMGISLEQDHK